MTRVRERQTGSAVVEFVLVAPLVILVFAAIVQVGLAGYVRSTLVASAAEGARAGAELGATTDTAVLRTRAALAASAAETVVRDVRVTDERRGGLPVIAVAITARLPLFGLYGPTEMTVTGRALKEG